MTTEQATDVFVKSLIKRSLLAEVYARFDQEQSRKLKQLIDKVAVGNPFGFRAFSYKGEVYCDEAQKIKLRMPRLQRQFYPEMEKILAAAREIKAERDEIENFFSCVLMQSSISADMIRMLPDSLHKVASGYHINSSGKLTEQQINLFLQQNQHAVATLKKRLLLNILT